MSSLKKLTGLIFIEYYEVDYVPICGKVLSAEIKIMDNNRKLVILEKLEYEYFGCAFNGEVIDVYLSF